MFFKTKKDVFGLVIEGNQEFKKVFEEVIDYTFLSPKRLFILFQFAKHAKNLSGDAAEIGVYKGGSAKLLARIFHKKSIHLFDSFAGIPEGHPKNDDSGLERKLKGKTDLDSVKNYLMEFNNLIFYKGIFPGTAKLVSIKKFCFVHIDADLYESTKSALEFFYPKMVSGGIIICADAEASKFKGTKKALTEFFKNKKEFPIHIIENQCVIIKI